MQPHGNPPFSPPPLLLLFFLCGGDATVGGKICSRRKISAVSEEYCALTRILPARSVATTGSRNGRAQRSSPRGFIKRPFHISTAFALARSGIWKPEMALPASLARPGTTTAWKSYDFFENWAIFLPPLKIAIAEIGTFTQYRRSLTHVRSYFRSLVRSPHR